MQTTSDGVIRDMLAALWAEYGEAEHEARRFRAIADKIRERIVDLQSVGRDAASTALAAQETNAPVMPMAAAPADRQYVLAQPGKTVQLNADGSVRRKPGRKAKSASARRAGKPQVAAAAKADAPKRGRKPGRKPRADSIAAAPAAPKKRGRPAKAKGVTPRRKRGASTTLPPAQPTVPAPGDVAEGSAFL